MDEVLKGGDFNKFAVIKNEDVESALSLLEATDLVRLLTIITEYRKAQNKNPLAIYLVINTDEPYANKIVDILKEHGHWG